MINIRRGSWTGSREHRRSLPRGPMVRVAERVVDVYPIGENPQRVRSERRSLSVRVGWHHPMLCTAERRTMSASYHARLTSELRRDAGARQ